MPDPTTDIASRSYSLAEKTEGQHYTAFLTSDKGDVYTVHCHHGAWTCNCPAMKFRKRGEPECKHIFRLRARLEEQARERGETQWTRSLPPEQVPGVEARQQYQEQLKMSDTNSTTIAKPQRSSVEAPTPAFNQDQVNLIRRLICPRANDDELALFLHQCQKTGLDPLARQIHAVMRNQYDEETGKYVDKLTIQTGIDGYWLVADRTGRCAGNDPTEFGPEFEPEPGVAVPRWARVTIYKVVGGKAKPFVAECKFSEYCARKRDGKLVRQWKEKPYRMLEKCAEAAALRKAFPQELSGVFAREEMLQDEEPERVPSSTTARLPGAPVSRTGELPHSKPQTGAQSDRIEELRLALNLSWEVFLARVEGLYGQHPAHLDERQSADLIAKLEAKTKPKSPTVDTNQAAAAPEGQEPVHAN